MARNTMGATTPSEVFSATVSTAARAMPARSSRAVSRPTIMLTAWRAPSVSPADRARQTFMLSVCRDFAARICQHMTLSAARPSQGLIPRHSHSSRAGIPAETETTSTHRIPPARRSPFRVAGKRRRSSFSRAEISFPTAMTGWGKPWGSPSRRSIPKPASRAYSVHIIPPPPAAEG